MKKLFFLIGVIALCIACDKTTSDFQSDNFIKYFGKGNGSSGNDIIELSDGGLLFTGFDVSTQFRKQIIVGRADKSGNLLWEKYLGTEHFEEGTNICLVNNYVFVAGNKTNFITGINEVFLLKLSLLGDSIDYKSYSAGNNRIIYDMAVSDEYIFLAGEEYVSNQNQSNFLILCLNLNGDIIWERIYGSSEGRQTFKKILLKQNGNILLVGTSSAIIGSSFTHIAITELNSSGIPLGALTLPAESNQNFGDAFYNGSDIFIFYSSISGNTETCHLVSVTGVNSINWSNQLNITGRSKAIFPMSNSSILMTSEVSNRTYFYTVVFSDNQVDKTVSLRSYPGTVSKIIGTGNGRLVAIGTNSATYGSLVRIIKTDRDLSLLKL